MQCASMSTNTVGRVQAPLLSMLDLPRLATLAPLYAIGHFVCHLTLARHSDTFVSHGAAAVVRRFIYIRSLSPLGEQF